jgi:lia operon protein LiaF
VKLSRLHKMMAGVVIILTGIGLLLDGFGIISFGILDLWPLVLIYFGIRLWSDKKKIRGGILLFLGLVISSEILLGIGIEDIFQFGVPLLFIYFGYGLIRGKSNFSFKRKAPVPEKELFTEDLEEDVPVQTDPPSAPSEGRRYPWKGYRLSQQSTEIRDHHGNGILMPKDSRSVLIGDFHLTSGRFELNHLHVWHGIGDVVIDLSRAMLGTQEARLSVDGWIGDVTIYVPVDLPVSVSAEVSIGDLEVFGHRQGGISRCVMVRSDHYDTDPHANKVQLHISLLVGDIKVKYI